MTDKDKENDKKFKLDDTETNKLMHIDETAIDGIELMAHYKHNHDDEDKPSTEDEKEVKSEETAEEEGDRDMPERDKDMSDRDKDMSERDKDMSEKEKDSFSEMEDDEKYNKSDTDNESDGRGDKREKNQKFKNLKVFINFYLVKSSRCILHIAIYAIDTVLIYVISFFLTNF